ncbi:SDR family oxidoreductase [Caulobacter sp. 73W]|uniref:D-xylose 1-dehydrogenase n=1 Tax=Caulobacter sp. 73W TaxID=3161137 RepID=A0AB39KY86_9CAUL
MTGAGRGIGRAIALGLASHGANVAVHGREAADGQGTVAEIHDMRGKAKAFGADLADASGPRQLADEVVAEFGQVDILVLNASVEIRQDWLSASAPDIDLQLAVDFRSSLLLCQVLAPQMADRRWGRIIMLGSIQQTRPNPDLLVYGAAKAAQAHMAANLARHLGRQGVTVNNLSPGAIATDRNAVALSDPTYRLKVELQIPAGRLGRPEDCVGACVLLASDAGAYINGADLAVDGGWGA